MSKLNDLKLRRNTIDITYRISCAMCTCASVNITSLQRKIYNSSKCINIYTNKKQEILDNFSFKLMNNTKKALILISTDKGMCGNFSNNTINLLKNNESQYDCWYLLGQKFAMYHNNSNRIFITPIETNINNLYMAFEKIFHLLAENEIGSLDIAYNNGHSVEIENVFSIEPLFDDMHTSINNNFYNNNFYNLPDEILTDYLSNQIYKIILDSQLEENKKRAIAMEEAKQNAIIMKDELNIMYNRVRQEKITNEINETISAI